MTPGARLKAAIDALAEIERGDLPADAVLERFFKGRRYIGAKDRRAVAGRVYDVLRRRARIDWWLGSHGVDPDPRRRVLASLMLEEDVPAEQAALAFNGARHCPEALTAPEAALAEALAEARGRSVAMPASARLDYPDWLDGELRASLGPDLEVEMEALNRAAPLDLRVNILKADRDGARAALAAEGVSAEPVPLSPWGLRVAGRTRLGQAEAFQKGWIEVQDEGSQLIALLADARPGMMVVDACAGAGGKTLALAAAMGGRGRLVACDVSAARLRRMDARLRRAGVANVEILAIGERDGAWSGVLGGVAQRVLVDAPCSGTGTWRRHPDAKWRLTPGALDRVVEVQARMLDAAARAVAPGGRLIYATCSVLRRENEDQIAAFLARAPGFRSVPVETVWPGVARGPCPSAGALRLSPARTGTDGFHVAILERA